MSGGQLGSRGDPNHSFRFGPFPVKELCPDSPPSDRNGPYSLHSRFQDGKPVCVVDEDATKEAHRQQPVHIGCAGICPGACDGAEG
jgi:hypothetical protein